MEFDTSVICHVFMHCFGSFLLQCFKSPSLCFQGTKYEVNQENVVYLHSTLWRQARLWLTLLLWYYKALGTRLLGTRLAETAIVEQFPEFSKNSLLSKGWSVRLFAGNQVKRHLPSGSLGSRALQIRHTHHAVKPTHPQTEGCWFVESVEEPFVVLLQATFAVRQ